MRQSYINYWPNALQHFNLKIKRRTVKPSRQNFTSKFEIKIGATFFDYIFTGSSERFHKKKGHGFLLSCSSTVLNVCDVSECRQCCAVLQMIREGNKFILAIREVLIEDSGIFTCRATNPAGVAECSAELFVEGDLVFWHQIPFFWQSNFISKMT